MTKIFFISALLISAISRPASLLPAHSRLARILPDHSRPHALPHALSGGTSPGRTRPRGIAQSLFLPAAGVTVCGQPPSFPHRSAQRGVPPFRDSSGIEGFVYSVSGNRMPSPSLKPGPHPGTGVRSTIYIFRLTNTSQVTRQGQSPYYSAVNTQLVGQADTDDKGHFSVLLPPGSYSVFTKKGNLFYASRMDEKNNISPVQVSPGKMTKLECRVESDHRPVY